MLSAYRDTYFDLPENWDADAWQKRTADQGRAKLAAEWLPDIVRSVLDVGCGNGVYTNLVEAERFKVGLDLSKVALANVSAPHLLADAVRLPFSDVSFDAAVCMELLEHLPEPAYEHCLSELQRVSKKYILISVPYNEKLEYSRVICPKCQNKFHQYHHLRGFNDTSFTNLFGPGSSLLRLNPIIKSKQKALPGVWNLYRVFSHRRGLNFPLGAVCPSCGYSSSSMSSSIPKVRKTNVIRRFVNRVWPQESTHTWWMALYEKAS